MKRALPFLLFGLGLFSLGVGLLWGLLIREAGTPCVAATHSDACVQPASVEFAAPDLALIDTNGNPVRLSDELGKVVLLNTWATWCPPCLAEMPDLQRFYELHRTEPFTLLAVNIGESLSTVERFIQQTGLTFPVWMDPEEKTLRALNTISLPSSIVIDPEGVVRMAWSGATCLSTLESEASALIP